MQIEKNPFQELYVTETAEPREFVKLFSPFLIQHAQPLFSHGNVVLRGSQGCGKSMLLNLLRPEIRVAYYEAGTTFPVTPLLGQYVSAGINMTRSGATYIGQRPINQRGDLDERLFPLFFADFVNYWIVIDLLNSLLLMGQRNDAFPDAVNSSKLGTFAQLLASQDCWFGYLRNTNGLAALKARLEERIGIYRAYHAFNIDTMPADILNTKTTIGEPISCTAECLRQSGVLPDHFHVFVRIDQHEVLPRSDDLRPGLGDQYRRVINKALSTRDPRVSYKIGTRTYAWQDDMKVFGTSLSLEQERDYRVIDLDELLRRREDRSSWIFPEFAKDVFHRRLIFAGYEHVGKNSIRKVMGSAQKPEDAAQEYVGHSGPDRALRIDESWPEEWQLFLRNLFVSNPLSAKLAEAWLRQRGGSSKSTERTLTPPPCSPPYAWERTYWRKERVRQALMQLASRCGQRLMWSGADSILALSAGSTLVFLSLCQHIWDVFLRSQIRRDKREQRDPVKHGIERSAQSVGILTASKHWYHKITELPGGSDRQRFVDLLGRTFQERLLTDLAMSNPGHNGFSLSKDEFESDALLVRFLGDAVDFGDLQEARHTTKSKNRKERIKWYLSPVLSPHLRLPDVHVKEPLYVSAETVHKWLNELGVIVPDTDTAQSSRSPRSATLDHRQTDFFADLDGSEQT